MRDLWRLGGWAACACAIAACLAAPATAGAALIPLGSFVPVGSGESLGATAISGGTVFAGARQATFDARDQGAVFAFNQQSAGWSGTPHESAVLTASDPAAGDGLGQSLSAWGPTLAAASARGGVYVFTQPAGGWTGTVHEAAILTASDGVVLSNPIVSGQTIFAQGSSATAPGAVYVFIEPSGGWSGALHESAKLTASDGTQYDGLGASIAVDGSTVVAGAPEAKVGSDSPGAVYVFTEPAGGWSGTINETAKLTGSDITTHTGPVPFLTEFGSRVAISGGTIAAVLPMNIGDLSGDVYVFTEPSGGWQSATQSAKLTAPNDLITAGSGIASLYSGGGSLGLAVSGNTIAVPGSLGDTVTQPVVFMYNEPAAGWSGTETESATLRAPGMPLFPGQDTATPVISGQSVIAGVFGAASDQTIVGPGPTYVFDRPSGAWSGTISPSATLTGTGGLEGGREYVFAKPSGGWANSSQSATIAPSGNPSPVSFSSASLSGSTAAAVGDAGAYVFSAPQDGWASAGPAAQLIDPGGNVLTGVTQSGATLAALARPSPSAQAPAADVFSQPAGGWSGKVQPAARLTPSDGASLLALTASGSTIFALGDNPTPSVYVFSEPPMGWAGTIHETARVPLPQYSDLPLISAQDNTVVLGGVISGPTIVTRGTAYVLVEPAGGWPKATSPTATLNAPAYEYGWLHVYAEPYGGWSGTVQPTARLVLSPAGDYAGSLGVSGSTIAVAGYQPTPKGMGCPCTGGVWLFSEPSQGWHGILTARPSARAQADYGSNIALAIDRNTVVAGGLPVSGVFGDTDTRVFSVTEPIIESPVIPGPPTSTRFALTGLTAGRPKLGFTLTAGSNAPPLGSLSVALPPGLRFSRRAPQIKQGVTLGGTYYPGSVQVLRGRLAIRFTYPLQKVTIRIGQPALIESRTFRRRIENLMRFDRSRRHRHKRELALQISAPVLDAAGQTTRFVLRALKP